jgi:hypothetical protein
MNLLELLIIGTILIAVGMAVVISKIETVERVHGPLRRFLKRQTMRLGSRDLALRYMRWRIKLLGASLVVMGGVFVLAWFVANLHLGLSNT